MSTWTKQMGFPRTKGKPLWREYMDQTDGIPHTKGKPLYGMSTWRLEGIDLDVLGVLSRMNKVYVCVKYVRIW